MAERWEKKGGGWLIAPEELKPDGFLIEEIKQQNESEKVTGGMRLTLSGAAHSCGFWDQASLTPNVDAHTVIYVMYRLLICLAHFHISKGKP